MPMDPILQGVTPVNSPGKPRTATKQGSANSGDTGKQDAARRHQRAGDASDKSRTFGKVKIDPDVIEKRIIDGLGDFHPNNKLLWNTEQLKANADTMQAKVGAKPQAPTPFESFGTDNIKAPHTFAFEAGHKLNSVDEVNNIMLEDKRVSIAKLGQAMVNKVTEGRRFDVVRAETYKAYLAYITEALDTCIDLGKKYEKRYAKWEKNNEAYMKAAKMYQEQSAWDAALTSSHIRAIEQDKAMKANQEQMDLAIEDKLKSLGVIDG